MYSDDSGENFKKTLKNMNYPFSHFQEKHSLTYLNKICTIKQNEIDTKTKELVRDDNKKRNSKLLLIEKHIKEDEEKQRQMKSVVPYKNKQVPNEKLDSKLKLNTAELNLKVKKGKITASNLFKSHLIKNKTTSMFKMDKQLTHSRTSTTFFVTNAWNHKSPNTSQNQSGGALNNTSQVNTACPGNKMNLSSSSFVFTPRSLNYSISQKTFTSPMKAKYKYISDTLIKSVKESDRLNRNINFFMNKQRKNKVSSSFPKKGKSKTELELEGKYEELTEKMEFKSKSFKEHYISFKNKRTGDYHIVRSGYADLMSYIDNYSKMEDGLFYKYKRRIKKMYPIIQEAADIRVIPDEDEMPKIANPLKNDDQEDAILMEKELSPTAKKIRDLNYSLIMRKRKLMNRLDENIEMSKHF